MADHVLKEMKQLENYQDKADLLFEFLKLVNKKQYDYFQIEYMVMNRKEQERFIADVEEHGIYIHQPPAYGNTTTEQFETILKTHPEWCTPYQFENIERPMVMGDIYFIRLKHESSNKSSTRSSGTLNVKNLPSKSALKKDHRILVSNTPIRLGEMEVANLALTKHPEIIEKLLKTYSTNEDARELMITQLLAPGRVDGIKKDIFNMDIDFDPEKNRAISREILEKYFNVLGYSLVDNIDEENE